MYDVIVIGGGSAGMIAAGRAGQLGQSVLLLEKNKELGVKLLMTGKDRCNVTHFTEDKNELIEAYGRQGRFLYSSFAQFGNLETMQFFEGWGVRLKVERGQRVFPVSDRSSDIRQALLAFLDKSKVTIRTRETVVGIESGGEKISQIALSSGEVLRAKKYIITTGGLSYPATGSTGDGYDWARGLGHTIIEPRPALSPIVVKNWFIKELEGLSLRNVELSIFQDNKKVESRFGEMLFTKTGISGPIVLDLSKKVGELLGDKAGLISPASQLKNRDLKDIVLKLDLKSALDFAKLDKRIQRDFQAGNNKQFKNILENLLPKKLIPVIIKMSKINPDKQVNLITKKERKTLLKLLKTFPLKPEKLLGFEKAIITTGGIYLKEINSSTMQSRLINNLYFAGEILDLDGPTGGYNLQVAWSTGWVAGSN